jgi:hypothetical protein
MMARNTPALRPLSVDDKKKRDLMRLISWGYSRGPRRVGLAVEAYGLLRCRACDTCLDSGRRRHGWLSGASHDRLPGKGFLGGRRASAARHSPPPMRSGGDPRVKSSCSLFCVLKNCPGQGSLKVADSQLFAGFWAESVLNSDLNRPKVIYNTPQLT